MRPVFPKDRRVHYGSERRTGAVAAAVTGRGGVLCYDIVDDETGETVRVPRTQVRGELAPVDIEDFYAWLVGNPNEEPPDGAMILLDEEFAWGRTDRLVSTGEPHVHAHVGPGVGAWFPLDGDADAAPYPFAELISSPDPDNGAEPPTWERLYTPRDVARLLVEYATACHDAAAAAADLAHEDVLG